MLLIMDNTALINHCKEEERKYSQRQGIYFRSIVLGFIVGVYGVFGIKDNDALKYSVAGTMAAATAIAAGLHNRSIKKRNFYRNKISELEERV